MLYHVMILYMCALFNVQLTKFYFSYWIQESNKSILFKLMKTKDSSVVAVGYIKINKYICYIYINIYVYTYIYSREQIYTYTIW